MPAPISAAGLMSSLNIAQPKEVQPSGAGFQQVLEAAVKNVESTSATANQAVTNFVSGGPQELHSTILAVQNAELQFELFMQARNKVVSAYEEIMRMQV
jgi:flagellar hook-basal body complex protein FliE